MRWEEILSQYFKHIKLADLLDLNEQMIERRIAQKCWFAQRNYWRIAVHRGLVYKYYLQRVLRTSYEINFIDISNYHFENIYEPMRWEGAHIFSRAEEQFRYKSIENELKLYYQEIIRRSTRNVRIFWSGKLGSTTCDGSILLTKNFVDTDHFCWYLGKREGFGDLKNGFWSRLSRN